jgi:hypothetical protein
MLQVAYFYAKMRRRGLVNVLYVKLIHLVQLENVNHEEKKGKEHHKKSSFVCV